ncbi:hypothetical protein [Congregibacter sp.]|uniref:hypothetical protein n=1 Tax=Congregibacter sp. TaxID=2744308 RepID=UPI003F6B8251
MATETDERYDIAFAGECLEGHDPQAVRQALGDLFNADEGTLERLFSGTRQRIKRNCDKATALKYQKSLGAAGAKAIITKADNASVASNSATAVQDAAPTANAAASDTANTGGKAIDGSAFELLPGGSDVLRPEERASREDVAIDLSHLSLGETGDRLSDETTGAEPAVTAPDYDVAEPGARMGPVDTSTAPDAPDISSLDLAPAGVDLVDSSLHTSPATQVNIDHLNLAESGSDLLTEDERSVSDAQAPDTSHLKLDGPANPFDS